MTKHPVFGWFSAKQATIGDVDVYAAPDGSEVILTALAPSDRREDVTALWDDFVCVGPVVKRLRTQSPALLFLRPSREILVSCFSKWSVPDVFGHYPK